MTRFISGSLRAATWRRRHLLLAIALAAAVIAAVEILRPAQIGSTVVVLTQAVPPGAPIPASAMTITHAETGVPEGALAETSSAVGRVPVAGLPAGTLLSESLLVGGSIADSAPMGRTVLPVAIADPGSLALAQPGRTVTLLGGESGVLGVEALVLAVLPPEPAGMLSSGASEVTTLLLVVHNNSISVVADASATAPLRVAVQSGVHPDT